MARFSLILLALVFAFAARAQDVPGWSMQPIVKFASDGTPILVRGGTYKAAVADGVGGAIAKGAADFRVGSVGGTFSLARGVSLAELARVGGVLARAAGPLALGFAVIEGLEWIGGQFMKPNPDNPVVVTSVSCSMGPVGTVRYVQKGGNGGVWWRYRITTRNDVQPGEEVSVCIDLPPQPDGNYLRLVGLAIGSLPGVLDSVPATYAEIDAAVGDMIGANPTAAGNILGYALADPKTKEGAAEGVKLGPQTVSGPATVREPATTTTESGPAGITTRTTVRQHDFTYSGNTVDGTTTSTTTVTLPDGTTSTSTTTTGGAGADIPPDGNARKPPDPPPDVCKDHPDASGCEPLGDPEDGADLQTQDVGGVITQAFGASGSCPAAVPLNIMGKSYSLAFTPVCDFAGGVRPVVLAVAWLSAGLFIFAVGKS